MLLSLANRANDDGSDVWVSKTRVSAETELARSTVVSVMQELERDGTIRAVGKKAGNHGYTVVYHMSVEKLAALPDAWSKCSNPNTLDEALGEEQPEGYQVTDHATLKRFQVSKSTRSSVRLSDKNNPYRTKILNPSDSKKGATRPKTQSDEAAYLLWESQRVRASGDRERAQEMEERAHEMMRTEAAGAR